jgi:hypothetical protein
LLNVKNMYRMGRRGMKNHGSTTPMRMKVPHALKTMNSPCSMAGGSCAARERPPR